MAAAPFGPCEAWEATFCEDVTDVDPTLLTSAVMAATEVLWFKSGRVLGVCEATVRPCSPEGIGAGWVPWGRGVWGPGGGPVPYNAGGGVWFNITCGHPGGCSCVHVCEVPLPGAPVIEVTEVLLDGVVLTDGVDYRVDDWSNLVRLGANECWPLCQDMTLPDSEVGTWSVTWTYGEVVPSLGALAVGELAFELVKFCAANDCALPRRVTTLSRDGETMTIMDPMDFFEKNRTGLYLCDLFLTSVNPHALTLPPAVWSPEVGDFGRRAGT